VDRRTGECIAWVTGQRDIKTVRKLYKKIEHLNTVFYTDNWEAFTAVLPKNRHFVGKKHTTMIEQNNSNTRHHLGRMARRTKIVSRSIEMVELSMRLWVHVNKPNEFAKHQAIFSKCIFT